MTKPELLKRLQALEAEKQNNLLQINVIQGKIHEVNYWLEQLNKSAQPAPQLINPEPEPMELKRKRSPEGQRTI